MPAATAEISPKLLRQRNETLAKSFYRRLKTDGFSHEEIIELSATLLDLVNADLGPAEQRAN